MATDVTDAIAQFVAGARYESVPARALETAKLGVLDCLGVALAGSKAEDGQICAHLARQEEAKEEASVYGYGFPTSATQAAFANGVAAHAEDYDHSFVLMGQPTAPLIPAVFALGEALGSSGRQVLDAYITGFEVTAKLAFSLREAGGGGWHANGTVGVFGATAACAKLLGLNASQVKMAVGIAASMASGLSANFGTMTKPLHVGQAARNGVLAAKLARAGYTANGQALEARNGYFAAFYRGSEPDRRPFEELGRSYALETSGVRIKPYPCGGLTHTAIDTALRLRQEHAIGVEMIDAVDVDVMEATFTTIAFRVPTTGIEGKFCMGYLIARALVDGAVTLDSFRDEAVRDRDVLRLAEKVEMRIDPALRAGSSGARSARVTTRLRNGEVYTVHCQDPKGSPAVPMTAQEMEAKFRECARLAISEDTTKPALEMIDQLEALDDVGRLCGLLRGSN